jgi:hypothetical protein
MTVSLYRLTVPVFLRGLENLDHLLSRAEELAPEKNIDLDTLVTARLAPDMFTLAGQIQGASDASKFCAGRLAGAVIPGFPDTERTFAELHQRIADTIAFLNSVSEAEINSGRIKKHELKLRGKEVSITPEDYALKLAIPNFFFHVAIAHGILRNAGIDVGKPDYLGAIS